MHQKLSELEEQSQLAAQQAVDALLALSKITGISHDEVIAAIAEGRR